MDAARIAYALGLVAIALCLGGCSAPPQTDSAIAAPATGLWLITEPAAGIAPVIRFISSARHSVEVVMYEFEDRSIERALAGDAARGVDVRVLLNGGYYGDGFPENEAADTYLRAHGVAVRWTPRTFALTHQKSVEVDGRAAMVLSFNFTPQYYASSRDFGVIDTDAADVHAIQATFAGDYSDHPVSAPGGDDLVWSPGAQGALVGLIDSAHSSLEIYNEEMAAASVVRALSAAARRGVDVRVVMTEDSSWNENFAKLTAAGAHVHLFAESAPLYIHAKMVLADGREALIGSENFSSTSLDRNRELGLLISSPAILSSLQATFDGDYRDATPFRG